MKKIFILVAAVAFPLIINAQVKKKVVAPKEIPSRIRVYTPAPSTTTSSTSDNSYKWSVKTDLFSFIAGEFPAIFEYRIASKLSVEGSAGITYSFIPNEFLSAGSDQYNEFESKAAMGSAFRAAIKYYPSSDYDAIEGWSFGIQLFNKTNNREYTVSPTDSNYDALNGVKNTKTKTGISLIIGRQLFEDSNITYESFIGVGFASVVRDYYTSEYNNVTSTYDLKENKTKETVPNFQLGLRIGFGN